jgi:hypothetical protein
MFTSTNNSNNLLTQTTIAMAFTENGAASLETTGDARVDLFFKLVRNLEGNNLLTMVDKAWDEDALDTMRILFHGRDCRGGKGDRKPFLQAMTHIANSHPEWVSANLKNIPLYGRWLDMIELFADLSDAHRKEVVDIISDQLAEDLTAVETAAAAVPNAPAVSISLLAKWFPTEGKKWDRVKALRKQVCIRIAGMSGSRGNEHLRKVYLTPLRTHLNIVEHLMCTNQWDKIDYSKVPSCAITRLKKAFAKHDEERYKAWLQSVREGKSKINTSVTYPHDLVRQYMDHYTGLDATTEEQWKSLVARYADDVRLQDMCVVSDVSGSMSGTPMEVSIALGILIATVCKGPFHKKLITFHEQPTLFDFGRHETLYDTVQAVAEMPWGGNTNLQRVIDLVLNTVDKDVPDMPVPGTLLILSDMQFDTAMGVHGSSISNFKAIKEKFAASKKKVPNIVFWNLRGDTRDSPVTATTDGVTLLSGFSPALLKLVVDGVKMTPYTTMRAAIDDERYEPVCGPE